MELRIQGIVCDSVKSLTGNERLSESTESKADSQEQGVIRKKETSS